MIGNQIGSCGCNCEECPAYKAWKTDDQALRVKTAAEWSKAYNFPCTPEMVNCAGCRAESGPKIGHCSDCEMRVCAAAKPFSAKALGTCAECGEHGACAKVLGFWKEAPQAKTNLGL
jgi:hypothetical protein